MGNSVSEAANEPPLTTAHVPEPENKKRVHLPYLDALRGLAALVVVLHHAYGYAIGDRIWQFPSVFHRPYHLMLYAHYAVDVFIVLSGYCLMLPVVLSNSGQLPGGLGGFLKRRARRILPPYYLALALSVAVVVGVSRLQARGFGAGEPIEALTAGGILSHLLMVHNLSGAWAGQANAALWSVATEWQIYFFFPLLLLPLWKRFGMAAAVGGSAAVGILPLLLYPPLHHALEQACPWYLVLFALGMAAASLNYSERGWAAPLRKALPWRFLPVILLVGTAVLFKGLSGSRNHLLTDPVVGLLVGVFLAYCTWEVQARTASGAKGLLTRLLEARLLVWLGSFSYSVYLVPLPLQLVMRAVAPPAAFSPAVQFLVVIPAQILLTYALSYGFFLVCERPFLQRRPLEKSPVPAAVSGTSFYPA